VSRCEAGGARLAGALVAAALVAGAVAAAGSASSAASTRPVPATLVAVESGAEDIIDMVFAGQRAQAIARATALQATARGPAAADLAAAGTRPSEVALLRTRTARLARRARAGSKTEILLAANALSELMPRLYARFSNRVPPAVLTLDYLDREAEFRSLARQGPRIPAIVARLGRTWGALRPGVVAKGGGSEAAAYQRHVAAMRALSRRPGAALEREAVNGLNLVDEIEGVFAR